MNMDKITLTSFKSFVVPRSHYDRLYLFIYLFVQYLKRVVHLATIASLPCGP